MTLNELLNDIKNQEFYILHSLVLKSFDDYGCIYKYLRKNRNILQANRVELFIALDITEIGSGLDLLDRTVIMNIEVDPAK